MFVKKPEPLRAAQAKGHEQIGNRRTRLWILLLFIAVVAGWNQAEARLNDLGLSRTATASRDLGGTRYPQGCLPGQILTPMFRLDLGCIGLEGGEVNKEIVEGEGDVTFKFPDDRRLELVAMRIRFSGTRAKDVGAIAIAIETNPANNDTNTPLLQHLEENGDVLVADDPGQRLGDLDDGYGVYTPEQDPIIAYIPMNQLFNDPVHPLSPYSTNFSVTINLLDGGAPDTCPDVNPFYAGDPVNATDEYIDDDYKYGQAAGQTAVNAAGLDEAGLRYRTFYVLVAPSDAIQNGSRISCGLDVGQDTTPAVEFFAGDGPIFSPDEVVLDDRYVVYNYNGGGLIIRVPEPACEDGAGENDPFVECNLDRYESAEFVNPLAVPANLEGTIICQQLVGDQVPVRTIQDRDVDVFANNDRVWFQFPPFFPPVSLASRSATDPTDYEVRDGRIHPDAGITTGSYPSPEVYGGGQVAALFGFDIGAGWAGGNQAYLRNLRLELQGLGRRAEIPRDGIDNDLDGLTDEQGVEDSPEDNQLPGRNDDVDFFVRLRRSSINPADGLAVNGQPLQSGDANLSQAIDNAFNNGTIQAGSYNRGWDPVFKISDIIDERNIDTGGETPYNTFSKLELPAKYYRDVAIPLNTNDMPIQPEVYIRFDEMAVKNPARGAYLASLIRIGALQSRGVDEDGDSPDYNDLNGNGLPDIGEPGVNAYGFVFANQLDDNGNGLVDEGIDEETYESVDNDADGKRGEDLAFVPAFLLIDEEINNFFVDAPGGRTNAFDSGTDYEFIDYNNNGVYDNGRNDQIVPNVDEYTRGPSSTSPLAPGDPYKPPIAFPIDDDLDAEREDGNPLTPRPVFDGVDNDGDGYADLGGNEDIRDFALSYYGTRPILNQWYGWAWTDNNANSRLDPGTVGQRSAGGDIPAPGFGEPADIRGIPVTAAADPERLLFDFTFLDSDNPGIQVPFLSDGKYDFFVALQIPPNYPFGSDFQISVYPDSMRYVFDTRPDYGPSAFRYPTTGSDLLLCRFPALENISANTVQTLARPNVYKITKRQINHLEIADGMSYRSPLEVAGGSFGRPYIDNLSNPMPVLVVNVADSDVEISERNSKLNSVRVNFDPLSLGGGKWNPTGSGGDLRPLSDGPDSGVCLYLDNKAAGEFGAFDTNDLLIPLSLETLNWNMDPNDPVVKAGGYYVTLKPKTGVDMPNTDYWEIPNLPYNNLDPNRGYDLFVCVRTNTYAGARNAFRAFIRPGDITFVNGRNMVGSEAISGPYVQNVPVQTRQLPITRSVIPQSDSIPVLGFNMQDVNNTFGGVPAGWATLSLFVANATGGSSFTPTDLQPVNNVILRNIPLDPAEDNDNDPRTFAIPDGIDNDDDGLTDEGVNNTLFFNPNRYTTLSGIAVFRDMANSDRIGQFDDPLDPSVRNPDLPVYLSGEEFFEFPFGEEAYITLALDHDPVSPNAPGKGDPMDPAPFETIPTNDVGVNAGDDYYVVIRTSKSISQGDSFFVGTTVLYADFDITGGNVVIGTPFGFMPGSTTGVGPLFPNRQPYNYTPLQVSKLVPSLLKIAEEPISPGFVYIPGLSQFDGFDSDLVEVTGFRHTHYESYKRGFSEVLVSIENGNDLPHLQFLHPVRDQQISSADSLVPGTAFLRWVDVDEDNPEALVTLVFFKVKTDPIFGELLPNSPGDRRFAFEQVTGTYVRLNSGDDIDDFELLPFRDRLLGDDNEGLNDVFTWDVRGVPPGLYRIAAILDDGVNARSLAIGGKVLIVNDRPVVEITKP